jgi:hypothetical protein
MSIYGSSPFNNSSTPFPSFRGADGRIGPTGPVGNQGNAGFGPTGPTGYDISTINLSNSIVNTVYTDGTILASGEIQDIQGNYYIEVTAATAGNFSPLQSSELVEDLELLVNGEILTFPVTRRLNFKNIKTNSEEFVNISFTDPDSTNTPETITISYNVFNLSASIVSGGPINSLVINNPGNIQSGFTGTTHGTVEQVTNFGLLNIAEQLAIVSKSFFAASTVNVWQIDPSQASVFYLAGYSPITAQLGTHVHGNHICIKKDTTTNSTKGFTIIYPKEFHAANSLNRIFYSTYNDSADIIESNFTLENFKNTFERNVIWQADSYFCPSNGKYDVVNFISIGSRYVGIPVHYNTTTNTEADFETVDTGCKPTEERSFFLSTFAPVSGICCKSDCTCETSFDYECTGYFYEGVTCGSDLCSTVGACCLWSDELKTTVPCQELTYCECATIAEENNLSFKWNKFTTIKKRCEDFNCSNAKNGIGACCDGVGGCTETTESSCAGYFQGEGVNCTTSDSLSVCISGNGSCCDSGITCSAGITGEDCLSEFKTYFGDGTTCGDFVCDAANIPCYSVIENQLLRPGDEFDGGIVVGIFNPNQTNCFGPRIFDGSFKSYASLTGTTLTNSEQYRSVYDYSGYGFDPSETCSNSEDSYLLIISKHPVNLDSSKQLVDGVSNTHEFIWSNGSVAWGPLVDISAGVVDELDVNNLQYKEGYIYDSSNETSSKLSLYGNSFLTCDAARFDTDSLTHLANRPVQSMIGNWSRNFGLYNTIRLVSSEYFYYNISVSQSGATLANYTPVTNDLTSARALSVYNTTLPSEQTVSSDWYIPSVDELGFVAEHCKSDSPFNLNAILLQYGYTPLEGWHWSSTGALNVSNNEGILTPSGITHGSEAWALNFDVDGNISNMQASRQNRTNTYKIRPVKMIRCDKQYGTIGSENYKVWNVPILSETIIDNS